MIPHLGIIMDGNRRWAKQRLLPAFTGHKAGADNGEKIIELAAGKGIQYLTLWGLATQNLNKRGKEEIDGIIKLINKTEAKLSKMIEKGLRFDTVGDISQLPENTQEILEGLREKTKDNTGITLILALVYGGQDEIIRGIKNFLDEGGDINSLDRMNFREYLDTGKYPPVDVIVRTGGDIRHSGFLLYDSEYSEYYFTDKKWPEFDEEELDRVIDFFKNAKRNFGK